MNWISHLGIGCSIGYVVILISKYLLCRFYLAKNSETLESSFRDRKKSVNDITVLIPILSGDPLLESTLRKNMQAPCSLPTRFALLCFARR